LFTFRCTRKLIKSLKADIDTSPPPPTTQLGDWYGNTHNPGHSRNIMFTSELSLLSVVMPLRERKSLLQNFRLRLAELLEVFGVAEDQIKNELDEMEEFSISTTASRSILASMRDLKINADFYVWRYPEASLLDLEIRLAQIPCGPLDMAFPYEVAVGLLLK
jgi:hypothetical protein